MKKSLKVILLIGIIGSFSCNKNKNTPNETKEIIKENPLKLELTEANNLVRLPLACVLQEYPNKLGQVVGDKIDLREPSDLHPAFYGCFDWHSAVHGHWSLIKLLKDFPDIEGSEEAISKLKNTITKENILQEVKYFNGKHNKTYERTYGWAWLLKLAEELHTWDNPLARELENNLQPLTNLIVKKYIDFIPKLVYPIRVGEHSNTAFGLSFALDYAKSVKNIELETVIKERAREFYFKDIDCPLYWEPSGFDFLSPCLEEANLMTKVLTSEEYVLWLDQFLPGIKDQNFQLKPGIVSDRTDGKLVHLDGVNFSRAWCLKNIAKTNQKYNHLISLANEHINYSLPSLVEDSYEGGHWLGSFAIFACQ